MKDLLTQHARDFRWIQINPSSISVMELLEFVAQAPCSSADPWLFDQFQLDLAQPALNYCARCPLWDKCDETVLPAKSFFDGVASGKVWRNGKILARLDANSPHKLIVSAEREDSTDAETLGIYQS